MYTYFQIYHPSEPEIILSESNTRHRAWRKLYNADNSFRDSLTEFRKSMQSKGFASRKIKIS